MNEKILPIKQPPVITFLHHAYPFGILMNYDEFLPAFHTNYLQLHFKNYFDEENIHYMNFYNLQLTDNSWLCKKNVFLEDLNDKNINVSEFIIDCIDQGFYVEKGVDEYYIENRSAYMQDHFKHELQIHGYNREKKCFYITGFQKDRSYTVHTATFDEIENSVISSVLDESCAFTLINKNPDASYKFNTCIVKDLLRQYINSENSSYYYPEESNELDDDLYWGMDVYKGSKKYFNLLLKNEVNNDIRPWHMLWEHKKCMLSRVQYMQNNNYLMVDETLNGEIEDLISIALKIRNLVLKYGVVQDKRFIGKIINHLDILETNEYNTLNKLLKVF